MNELDRLYRIFCAKTVNKEALLHFIGCTTNVSDVVLTTPPSFDVNQTAACTIINQLNTPENCKNLIYFCGLPCIFWPSLCLCYLGSRVFLDKPLSRFLSQIISQSCIAHPNFNSRVFLDKPPKFCGPSWSSLPWKMLMHHINVMHGCEA